MKLTYTTADQQLAVPPGNQEQQVGIGNTLHEPRRESMRLEVVQRYEGFPAGKRHCLCKGKPHGDATDQAGPGRDRDAVKPIKPATSLSKRPLNHGIDEVRMRPRRDLRHDPAIGPVRVELAGDDIRQDSARTRGLPNNHGGGCFVAAGFNAKHRQHEGSTHSTRWKIWRSPTIIYSLRPTRPPLSLDLPRVQTPIRIGTRGSPLALAQTRLVMAAIMRQQGWTQQDADARMQVVTIKTSGDRIQDRPLADVGGKGLFAKELEEALLRNEIDCAVHSLKDMPTLLPEGLVLDCILPREDPRDALVCNIADTIDALPRAARFATGSVRRQAQVLNRRPDLEMLPLRGNVDTRLSKVTGGDVDATLLAIAGLNRLGKTGSAIHLLPTEIFLPAVAQGAIGIETRSSNAYLRDILEHINDAEARLAVSLERAFLTVLDGSCKTPIAGYARRTRDGQMLFQGCALSPDGSKRFDVSRTSRVDSTAHALAIGQSAGEELLAAAGRSFFQV